MNKLTTAALILIIVALSVLLLVKSCKKEPEKVQQKPVHTVEYIQGKTDTIIKYITNKVVVPTIEKFTEYQESVQTIDTFVYLKDGGTIFLFSEDIKAKGIEVNADIPYKEIHSVDTLKITDSVYISCEIKWYEKPLFVSSVTAALVTGLEILLRGK